MFLSGEQVPTIIRLRQSQEQQIFDCLCANKEINLFLMGFLAEHPVDHAWWYGVLHEGTVTGVIMVLPTRLAVPWIPEPNDAVLLGRMLHTQHRPCLMVGPRETCDILWRVWAGDTQWDRYYEQRLYVASDALVGVGIPGFRRAHLEEWRTVAKNAGLMEEEDLGINPHKENPLLHEKAVRERIKVGRTFVISLQSEIVFQINVGTVTPWGCQIGGTYVPPKWRGQKVATHGMAELNRHLLQSHSLVTLHVNEANTPAVRLYERTGFVRSTPMRLITLTT